MWAGGAARGGGQPVGTDRAYTDEALFSRFLAGRGMPTAAASIQRKHVEAFIAPELERTAPSSAATRYRSVQQFFRWLAEEGEIDASPMAKKRPPIIPNNLCPCSLTTRCACCWTVAPAVTSGLGETWPSSASS